ncbi:MAG: hypothetical protein IPJ46_12875 [Anaerolineales bacterium]|nr:hypothetical protein [Anaerolineales bacterium]
MLLKNLFVDFPYSEPMNIPAAEVTGIAIDSRAVKPGYLFVAMQGGSVDGHDYISTAIANGAAAVVGSRELSGLSVPYIQLENPRQR